MSNRTVLKIILLIIGVAVLLTVPFPLPVKIGTVDFRPYWSSSFLLSHGQDFSNPAILYDVERTLTAWRESYTMFAWFAPTGNLVLLPYTLFPFTTAAYYWLLTNIAIIFFSVFLIWRNTTMPVWIPIVAAFSFSMTLISLLVGQVNTLVVLGLALFLFFSDLRRDYAAGASLVLTTIKPHLVILTLPLLLIDILWRKQWRVFIGFVVVLVGCVLILFVFYPAWPISFWHLVASGMDTSRATPTIPGLFVAAGELKWGKWVWVLGLCFSIVVWWKCGKERDRRSLVDVSILAGMMAAPIGWSYDQVMLLFPLLSVLEWVASGSLAREDAIAVMLVLITVDAITFYERIFTSNEIWFFWVPLVIAAVYGFVWHRRQVKLLEVAIKAC